MCFRTFEEIWWEEITGMIIDRFQLSMEVGSLPKVNFHICMNTLVEKLPKEKLEKLEKYCKEELKCRT